MVPEPHAAETSTHAANAAPAPATTAAEVVHPANGSVARVMRSTAATSSTTAATATSCPKKPPERKARYAVRPPGMARISPPKTFLATRAEPARSGSRGYVSTARVTALGDPVFGALSSRRGLSAGAAAVDAYRIWTAGSGALTMGLPAGAQQDASTPSTT